MLPRFNTGVVAISETLVTIAPNREACICPRHTPQHNFPKLGKSCFTEAQLTAHITNVETVAPLAGGSAAFRVAGRSLATESANNVRRRNGSRAEYFQRTQRQARLGASSVFHTQSQPFAVGESHVTRIANGGTHMRGMGRFFLLCLTHFHFDS